MVMVWYSKNPTEGPNFLFHPGGKFWLKSDFFETLGTLVFVVFAYFHDGTGFRPFLMRANNKSF